MERLIEIYILIHADRICETASCLQKLLSL